MADEIVYEQVTINGKEYLKRHKVKDLVAQGEQPKRKHKLKPKKSQKSIDSDDVDSDVPDQPKKKFKYATRTEGPQGKGKKPVTVRLMKKRIGIDLVKIFSIAEPPMSLEQLTKGNYRRFLGKFQDTCQNYYFGLEEKMIIDGAKSWLKSHWNKSKLPANVVINQKNSRLKQGFKSRLSNDRHLMAHSDMGWEKDIDVPDEADTLDWQFPAQVSYGRVAKSVPNEDYTEMEITLGAGVSKSALKYIQVLVNVSNQKIEGSGQTPKKAYTLNPELDKDFKIDCNVYKAGILEKVATELFEIAMMTEWMPEFADDDPELSDDSDADEGVGEKLVLKQHDPLKDP
eukprot:248882_1